MRLLWVFLAVMTLVATVHAGVIPAPSLSPGKYVYTVPSDFDPPMIGRTGLEEIQAAAEKLHYPYYVVIVRSFNGSSDDDAASAIDGLAEDWSNNPNYDVGKSSIFLLSFDPRKYRFLAGAQWKKDLGFVKSAHDPYTQIFKEAVSGTPKDPKGGIIAMMRAVDNYLWDQTDPTKIAERAAAKQRADEERRRQQEKARMESARASLGQETSRLANLLKEPSKYLPSDTTVEKTALAHAKAVQAKDVREEMLSETNAVKVLADKLEGIVAGRKHEEAKIQAVKNAKIFLWFFGIFLFLAVIVARFAKFYRFKAEFARDISEWRQRVQNANSNYVRFYEQRGSIFSLKDVVGKTKKLFDDVALMVDQIFTGVKAIENHLGKCEALAGKATIFNLRAIELAMEMITQPFVFDTGQINEGRLFESATKEITVDPVKFSDELGSSFQSASDLWRKLMRAGEIRSKTAESLFTQEQLDQNLAIAKANGIPERWLSDHPLFGDDESDQTLYDHANSMRMSDPLAFQEEIDRLLQVEGKIFESFTLIVSAVQSARAVHVEAPPKIDIATTLSPKDDPIVSFNEARQEETRLAGMLASSKNAAEIEDQAERVIEAYKQMTRQLAEVQAAIGEVDEAIATAGKRIAEAAKTIESAQPVLTKTQQVHRNTGKAEGALENAVKFVASANEELKKAKTKRDENRHLEARQKAWQSHEDAERAISAAQECMSSCHELEQLRKQYESKLAEMDSLRASAERKMHQYGRSRSLEGFDPPRSAGLMDYAALMLILENTESHWNSEVRDARNDYDAEQARIREEHEAEERRRRDSYESSTSSYSSSSGSDFGGGSSSSGGSFGGGDSSSSGGSW